MKREHRCQGCCHSQGEPGASTAEGAALFLEAPWPCWHVDFTLEPPKWWESTERLCQATETVVILRHSHQKPARGHRKARVSLASIGLWHSCGCWTWPASEDTPFLTQRGASGKAAGRGAFSKLYGKLSCREWLANLMALRSHVTPRLAPEFSASLCIFLLCRSLKEPDRLLALVAFSSMSPACPDAGTPGNTAPGFFSLPPWIVLITTWSLDSRWSPALTSPVCMDRWALWAHGNGLLCQEEQGTSFILENHQRGLD